MAVHLARAARVEGLIGCFGGKEAFTGKLDSLFVVSSVLEGAASPDISG